MRIEIRYEETEKAMRFYVAALGYEYYFNKSYWSYEEALKKFKKDIVLHVMENNFNFEIV